MGKIQLSYNKILKLTNVLIKEIEQEDFQDIEKLVELMENYIKAKGALPVGPLIQYTNSQFNDQGDIIVKMKILRQANKYIYNTEFPYTMESIIRLKNCMYVRYIGKENELKYAYDKINLTAFEEDISLSDESYTIFVNNQDEQIVTDIFVERLKIEN